jgi:hypothetical protein
MTAPAYVGRHRAPTTCGDCAETNAGLICQSDLGGICPAAPFDLIGALAAVYRVNPQPDDDQRCADCGHFPGCDCPHDCITRADYPEGWVWQ